MVMESVITWNSSVNANVLTKVNAFVKQEIKHGGREAKCELIKKKGEIDCIKCQLRSGKSSEEGYSWSVYFGKVKVHT